MKRHTWIGLLTLFGLLLVLALTAGAQDTTPQTALGTAFTYQGRLTDGGSPADGEYDLAFALYDAAKGGALVGTSVTHEDVVVTDGLFAVQLDFGKGAFDGSARYLQIGVRPGRDIGAYTPLDARQELTAAPYALYALGAPWSGLSGRPNLPPVAVLQAQPSVLYLGETSTDTVTLSMTLSYDPEGSALTYAFDPTGHAPGGPSIYGSEATASAAYAHPGDYLATGWVRDAGGALSRAQALVSVYRFGATAVDGDAGVNNYQNPSLAVVAGHPAVAYYYNADVRYARALDASGAAWDEPIHLPAGNLMGSGQDASLAVVDGYPAIAYALFSSGNGGLMYVRAEDALGLYWSEPITVVSGYMFYASMAIVDGNPAIAYYDSSSPSDRDLKYVRALDATGSAWGTPVTLDSAGDVGQYASLAVVDGYPAIAYFDDTSGIAKYVRALDATGSAWGTPDTVDSNAGGRVSLVVVDGYPAIAYNSGNPDYHLQYIRATNAAGSAWGTPVVVDSGQVDSESISLAVIGNVPAIAYQDGTNDDLRYVQALDASGSAWDVPITANIRKYWSSPCALAEIDGRPAIAFYDSYVEELRFAIPRQD